MSRKLEKLIHNSKLEFKVDSTTSAQGANNIVPAALTPQAKAALRQVQGINNTPPAEIVNNPGTKAGIVAAETVQALSK